ncbi:penicillin-binding protein activator [Thiomicrorhabdus sp.]|uniref:penicillin-binding protein activator n=1 Tax=Thiomicrorhabdus sp. TaxID=2039724 RepID=UPI003569FE49
MLSSFMFHKQVCLRLPRFKNVALCCALAMAFPAASLAGQKETPSISLQQQIEQIDQEIVLLRAELARNNGDMASLERYIHQLEQMELIPSFQARLDQLKEFFRHQEVKPPVESAFYLPDDDSNVVILLPLSGEYAVAGEAILSGINARWPFSKSPVVLDTAIYDNLYELWELVKLYSPDFVIGPLDRTKSQAWQSIQTHIPTLYLNQLDRFNENEKGLSPNKQAGLRTLQSFIENGGFSHLLVLKDTSESAEILENQFRQTWLQANPYSNYESYTLDGTADQTLQTALKVKRSMIRHNWLEKNIQTRVEFEPRARQDIEAVVHFLSREDAVQIKPLIDFYHLNRTISLWYPSVFPSRLELQTNLFAWQQTYVFLPPYLTQLEQQDSEENQYDNKSGLFYALGELAAEIIKNPRVLQPNQLIEHSPLGTLISDDLGELQLLPDVFWLDDKQLQSVPESQFRYE